MKGRIASARRGAHTRDANQYVVSVEGCNSSSEACALLGKKITIKGGKKEYVGKIASTHGTSGAVLARFPSGLPGQFLGREAEVG